MTAVIIILVIVAPVIFLVFKSFLIVEQSETMVIERFGRYNRTLHAGVNFIWPIVDNPKTIEWRYIKEEPDGRVIIVRERIAKIDLRETVYDFPKQSVITKDNVVAEINALLTFQIFDPVKAVYEVSNLPDTVEKLTQTTLRSIIGEMELERAMSSRDEINRRIQSSLEPIMDNWGVRIHRVELQEIAPPMSMRDALEKQMRAEREKRATILEAEGYQQSQVIRAKGDLQAKILHAQGEAVSRLKVANAESESLKKIADSLKGTREDPARYLIALSYINALKEMVSGKNNKVIYMPYEATGLLGSIAGIKEMFDKTKVIDPELIKR